MSASDAIALTMATPRATSIRNSFVVLHVSPAEAEA
jgi:hypothetical protein